MAPHPLQSPASLSPPLGLFSGALSTAASPLQASFHLSYRSPIRLTHNVHAHARTVQAASGPSEAGRQGGLDQETPVLSPAVVDAPSRPGLSFSALLRPSATCARDDSTDADDETRCQGTLGVASAVNIIVGKTVGVGAYAVPAAVVGRVGSVGMALVVWAAGSVVALCGLAVYLDLGTALPRSGGERVYLERIFRRPRMLATCVFMAYAVLLGGSAPNAVVLGAYALRIFGVVDGEVDGNVDGDVGSNTWAVRALAVVAVSALCWIHARRPRLGLGLVNVLGAAKMLMLVAVVLAGVAGGILGVGSHRFPARAGRPDHSHAVITDHNLDPDLITYHTTSTARRNFQDVWAGSSMQPYDYATALLQVTYCFRGYSTANQVLSDVRNPVRTLRVAAPLALALVSAAYLAVNVTFFLVVDKADMAAAGVGVAGLFFRNLLGDGIGARILPVVVVLSAAGNIAATSFAQARVNEELARDGLVPFAGFWTTGRDATASTSLPAPASPPPVRGLLLHWLVSVVLIVVPPPGRIYNFLVDIGSYPVSVISVAIAVGLLYLHHTSSERWVSPWPAPRLAVGVFAASNGLLLVLPWIPPTDGRGESERFAYYTYPATALAVLGSGALYWLRWRWQNDRSGHVERPGRPARGFLLSPGWAHLKSTMARIGGMGRNSRGSSSINGIDGIAGHSEGVNNPYSVDKERDEDECQATRNLLGDDTGSERSRPMATTTAAGTTRRRAPCGCPTLQ